MAERYAGRADFVFVYVREAHPGERYAAHASFAQKLEQAGAMVRRWGIRRRMLVDDLDGGVHRAYGMLPNMSYVIARGRVLYKASWTDPRTLGIAVEQALWEQERRREGTELLPYHLEMSAARVRDRPGFLAGLAETGPRAVREFIDAVRNVGGDGPARPLEQWWAANGGGVDERAVD